MLFWTYWAVAVAETLELICVTLGTITVVRSTTRIAPPIMIKKIRRERRIFGFSPADKSSQHKYQHKLHHCRGVCMNSVVINDHIRSNGAGVAETRLSNT